MRFVRTALNSQRTALLVMVAAAAAGLWAGRPGPLTAVDQLQTRLNMTAPVPHGQATIGQTFTAQHNGLSAVEVLASVPAGSPTVALTLRLMDEHGQTLAAQTFANIRHNQPLRLSFGPLAHSQGGVYTVLISAEATNTATVWAYSLGGYEHGAMLVAGAPGTADLQFSSYYTLLWLDALGQAAIATGRLLYVALPLAMVLFGPGWLLIGAGLSFGPDLDRVPAIRWGLALGLSLSVLPLAWLWITVVGGRLSALFVVIFYGLVGVGLVVRLLARTWGGRASWAAGPVRLEIGHAGPTAALGVIVGVGLAARLLAVRDLAFPSWVDSPHHALIVSLMAASGRVPDNYRPLLAVNDFVYHFGFHALAVTLEWLTGLSTPALFLLLGQVLNGLVPLAIYTLVAGLTRRPKAGLVAAFFVGLVSLFPAYYVSWGRYTQLAGAIILAPAVTATWALVPAPAKSSPEDGGWRRKLPRIVAMGLLAAGLTLTHYRVLSFFTVAVLVILALGGRGGWKTVLACALLAGLLTLPWLARLTTRALLPALQAAGGLAAENGYNALPTAYFQSGLERGWLVLAALAAAYGLWKRARPVWFALVWTAAMFALLNIGPGTWLVNNNSWTIMLFVPGSLLLGWGGDAWLQAAQSLNQATSRLHRVAGLTLLAGFAGLVAWAGLQGLAIQVGVANPVTVLAQGEDAQAIDWIEHNTPPSSVFLVNGWEWMPGIWAGSDGGTWLLPLTGRQTTLPPLDYLESADMKAAVNRLNGQAAALPAARPPQLLAWLQANGITHVFIGAHGGYLKPEMFAANTHYQLLFTNGPTWVYAVK